MLRSHHGDFGRFRTTLGIRPPQAWFTARCSDLPPQVRQTWLHAVAEASDGASLKSNVALAVLNNSQRAAAAHGNGPCRVIAGPGSGKTRVLVSRVAKLIENGVSPSHIMAITFTRKSGADMRERLNRLLGETLCKQLTIGTYHSICGSILRRWIRNLPGSAEYTGKFTTATDQELRTVLTKVLTYKLYQSPDFKNLKPEDQIDPCLLREYYKAEYEMDRRRGSSSKRRSAKVSPMIAQTVLTLMKEVLTSGVCLWPGRRNRLQFFQEVASKTYDTSAKTQSSFYLHVWPQVMAEVYAELEVANTVWIGMYIPFVNALLDSQPELLKLMDSYQYVLVDEVQDNDRAQYQFVSTICQRHQNVFFVGDLDQAIYQFRGADAKLFGTECTKTFPKIKDYGMYENYRSLGNIVQAAEVVACALTTTGGHLRPRPAIMRNGNLPVVFATAQNEKVEADRIITAIQQFLQCGVPGSEIAVLYPKHVYGDPVEMKLLKQKIAYRRYGNTEILNSAVGRDLLAYMVLAANPLSSPSLNRIFNKPSRGIGDTGWQKLQSQLAADPYAPTLPAFLFQGLDDVWVSSEAVQRLLDEFHKEEDPENAMVRLKVVMEEGTKAGKLAPELDFKSAHFPKKPTVRQRQALQGLRNLLVCVWSEAARYGPERAMAVLQILSGYRDHLLAIGDEGLDTADFFIVLMRESITDPDGGALGVQMEGAWDRAASLEPVDPRATAADALPDGPPRGSFTPEENEDYFQALLMPNPPLMQDYDPSKAPMEHVGMSLVRACADSMAFLESGPERQVIDDSVGTLGTAEAQKVQLMTMHKAKGLEFQVVILMGLSEYGMALGWGNDEFDTAVASRNLLYVAITRAKDALVFSSRRGLSLQPGKVFKERNSGEPSFLLKSLYEAFDVPVTEKMEYARPPKPGSTQPVLIANSGYPSDAGWPKVEALAQQLMQMSSQP